jgi:hypothetical protein
MAVNYDEREEDVTSAAAPPWYAGVAQNADVMKLRALSSPNSDQATF